MAPEVVDEALVIECDLDAPPAKVWRALAEQDIRAEWLGEAEAGPSEVRRADPGERLDLAWPSHEGESLISFEIAPSDDGGSRLTVTHRVPVQRASVAQVVPFKLRTRPMAMGAPRWRMAA
jgi:uncharacterized protein YndB with AHSA1/START domain